MTRDDERNLWRWAVHNRSFELMHTLEELNSTFIALVGPENTVVCDRYALIESQVRVCSLELEKLRDRISKIDSWSLFPSEDRKEEDDKQHE